MRKYRFNAVEQGLVPDPSKAKPLTTRSFAVIYKLLAYKDYGIK